MELGPAPRVPRDRVGDDDGLHRLVEDEDAPTAATVIQVRRDGQKQTLSRPGSTRRLSAADVRRADALFAAAQVLRRGAGAVAVEVQGEGKLVVWRGGSTLLERLPVEPVDTTGAGNAFAAGLAVGLAEGKSLREAARFANACSGLATTALGAQAALPRREAVDRLVAGTPSASAGP